ncbi:MAG: hypothetical protein U1E76_11045 [Planctomycetota bacterium]
MTDWCNQPGHAAALDALCSPELSGVERAAARRALSKCARCREDLAAMDLIERNLKEAGDLARAVPERSARFRDFMRTHIAKHEHDAAAVRRRRAPLARILFAAAAVLALAAGVSWLLERRPASVGGPDPLLGARLSPSDTITERPAFLQVERVAAPSRVTAQWEIELSAVTGTVFKTTVRDLSQRVALPSDVQLERGVPYLWVVYALDESGHRLHDEQPDFTAAFQIQP